MLHAIPSEQLENGYLRNSPEYITNTILAAIPTECEESPPEKIFYAKRYDLCQELGTPLLPSNCIAGFTAFQEVLLGFSCPIIRLQQNRGKIHDSARAHAVYTQTEECALAVPLRLLLTMAVLDIYLVFDTLVLGVETNGIHVYREGMALFPRG